MTSRRRWARTALVALAVALSLPATLPAQALPDSAKLEALKVEALRRVEGRAKQVQEIVDMLFSFSELGMQEFETQRYITDLLQREGFQITKGYAGMPSAWVARWVSPAASSSSTSPEPTWMSNGGMPPQLPYTGEMSGSRRS